VSSVAVIVAAPNYGAYSASKFALEALSMAMRAELAKSGVRVVVVRPGPVATPFRANAERADGAHGFPHGEGKSQAPEAVAAMTVRAVERGSAIVETSPIVWAASAATRFAPWGLRLALERMAAKSQD
jgi:short-subunit dehydrogenase